MATKNLISSGLLIYVVALAASLILILTNFENDLGFFPDSMAYLEVSQNIADGEGIVNDKGSLVSIWPPLFPILLAIASLISGMSTLEAGLYLNSILLFATTILFYKILKKLKIANLFALSITLLFLLSHPISLFNYYLSEGLFLFLLLSSFLYYIKYLNFKKTKFLLASGIFCGFMFLTRYAGIGFIGAYFIFLLLIKRSFFYNLKKLLIFIIPQALVIIPWFLYIASFDETQPIRKFSVHIMPWAKLESFFLSIAYWFIGGDIARLFFPFLLVFFLIMYKKYDIEIRELVSSVFSNYRKIILAALTLIICYVGFLFVTVNFFDQVTPLDRRILAPIFPFMLILLGIFLNYFKGQPHLKIFSFSILLFLLLNFSGSVLPLWFHHYKNGSGYTKITWKQSDAILSLNSVDDDLPVYSNAIEIITLHTSHSARIIPGKSNRENLNSIKQEIYEGKAILVFLDAVNWRNYLIPKQELLEEFDSFEISCLEDGFIIKKK
ncbi:glycosyltransferase family 39 protein [Antarcticibacterium sp. 1MA-6-2]|uniref:ArnT family glycosyltransferase n=1 Tax=Antarcticibacterium sp. 1MA-6-2 TaxID=2908210 RepID=UPI001F2F31C6|nr:glycosyltransferase family 39 protein [Antarcticibacterium sp. 1MA-6-2]UJH92506.1 glycosyltransferase family 39 protein [Antarcticibacterium sp. 1MA-6-2]